MIKSIIPFTAGISRMNFKKFNFFNMVGASLWIILFIGIGFLLGSKEIVRKNLIFVIFLSKILVLLPSIFIYLMKRRELKKKEIVPN